VILWDAQTGQIIRVFSGHGDWVTGVAFSPDGQSIVTASKDRTARIWDVQTGSEVRRLKGHAEWVNSAVFCPDGRVP
jgi:WD40 repeat protein